MPDGRPEADFAPEALDLVEHPPSPLGRAVGLALVALAAAAVAWASLGTVDVVAVARGRLAPAGHTKVVQPLEAGVVRAIHVADGARVRRGQVLVELDPTALAAEEARLVGEERAAAVHVARLRALLAGAPSFEPPPGTDPGLVMVQRQLLRDQAVEHARRLEAAALAIRQREAAVAAGRAAVGRVEALVGLQAERARAYRALLDRELIARLEYLAVEERHVDRQQELAVERQRLAEQEAALGEARSQVEVLRAEFTRARLAELADWETRVAALGQELVKARRRRDGTRLAAPVSGTVQQLAVHTVGGVVTPAQALLLVVPDGAPLEALAWVENKDIGFVEAGQPAEVKVDTFPFTRHGTVPGRVVSVSRDAVAVEGLGPAYQARVALDRATVALPDRTADLAPGMAVTVEIRLGRRRLVEYFLSPLLRVGYEALRER